MSVEVTVYNGKQNDIKLILSYNGIPLVDHTAVTRVVLKVHTATPVVVDSSTSPSSFDLTGTDSIALKVGGASIPAGRHKATLTIYDATHTSGRAWPPELLLNVVGSSEW